MNVRGLVVGLALAFAGRASAAPSLERAVTEALRPGIRPGLAIVKVELPLSWRYLKSGPVSFEGAMPDRAGSAWVKATLRSAKGPQTGYVRVDVGAKQEVIEPAREIHAGDVISAGDLKMTLMVVSGDAHPIADPRRLIGRKAAREIPMGQPISAMDLVAEVQVPRGTPVKVIAQRGLVRVMAQAVLEKSAVPGEETVARVIETHLLVAGRLVDRGTVINEGM